ncbi:hypothetical protein B0H14DRAFT_3533942 [Mycena olivaceomarginata]|nr:hypothetical protein B0H14DRAFT_3533942 [Mycena olivaceomarginata]
MDDSYPRFVFLPEDPEEQQLSALAKHKFYVVKKGKPGSEGVDLARPYVTGISDASHESCSTADEAREIWVYYCHQNHTHRNPPIAPPAYTTVTPPPFTRRSYSQDSSASVTRHSYPQDPSAPVTRHLYVQDPSAPRHLSLVLPRRQRALLELPSSVRRGAHAPVSPNDFLRGNELLCEPSNRHFFRVTGSPRVLIRAATAETELLQAPHGASLLVGSSLAEVEDDEPICFYRVFDSSHVHHSHEATLQLLIATQADGLLVGRSLGEVVD